MLVMRFLRPSRRLQLLFGICIYFLSSSAVAQLLPCTEVSDRFSQPCYEISGFPLVPLIERNPLFEDSKEYAGYAITRLIPLDQMGMIRTKEVESLAKRNAMFHVGYRFISFDSFQTRYKESRGVIFLLHGGPGNYSDYFKKKAKVILQQGFDVVLIDQRGGRDHRMNTLKNQQQQVGGSLPLNDLAEDFDPLVVADLIHFENQAQDVYSVIEKVMSLQENSSKKFFILGHSAGGTLLKHVMAYIGRSEIEEKFIPTALGVSGATAPGSSNDVLDSWILGAYVQHLKYMNHPVSEREKLELKIKLFFELIDSVDHSSASKDQKELLKAIIFDSISWDLTDKPGNLIEIETSVQKLIDDFKSMSKGDSNPVGEMIVNLEANNKYTFNRVYMILMAQSIGGGITDQQIYSATLRRLNHLGIDLYSPQFQYQINLIKGWPVYASSKIEVSERKNYVEDKWTRAMSASVRKSFYEDMDKWTREKKISFVEPNREDMLRGLKKAQRFVSINGTQDPVSSPLYNLHFWHLFFENFGINIYDSESLSRTGIDFELLQANSGHNALFEDGSEQLDGFLALLTEGDIPANLKHLKVIDQKNKKRAEELLEAIYPQSIRCEKIFR